MKSYTSTVARLCRTARTLPLLGLVLCACAFTLNSDSLKTYNLFPIESLKKVF